MADWRDVRINPASATTRVDSTPGPAEGRVLSLALPPARKFVYGRSVVPHRAGLWPGFLIVAALGLAASCGHGPEPPADAKGTGGGAGEGGAGSSPPLCERASLCDGVCVNLEENGKNCGQCGRVCDFDQICAEGECVCPPDTTLCESKCVHLNDDARNCGECASSCEDDEACVMGECSCPPPTTACAGRCVDLETEPTHCGTCGLACGPLDACKKGTCRHRPGPSDDNCGGAARNISITALTANQAVEIPIFDADENSPKQNAPLTLGRPLLIRAFVDTRPAFSARVLAARLFLRSSKGDTVFYDKREISGDSDPLDLASTFHFSVPEDVLSTTTTVSVELVECDAEPPTGPVVAPRAPTEGELALDFAQAPELAITIVPIEHLDRLPNTSDESLKVYRDAIHAMFPLRSVALTVGEPLPSGQTGALDFDLLLSTLQERRQEDQVEPDRYYYGFVRPRPTLAEHCADADCIYGIAYQSLSSSFHVALGIEYGDQASEDTFVHEIGHNMGLGHAPCGTDGDRRYPYEEARLGSIGFDFRSKLLLDPVENKDIMSYCEPAWVSDYTYRTVFAALSSPSTEMRRIVAAQAAARPRDFLSIRVSRGSARRGPLLRDVLPLKEPPLAATILDADGNPFLYVESYSIKTGDTDSITWLIPVPEPDWAFVSLADGSRVSLAVRP